MLLPTNCYALYFIVINNFAKFIIRIAKNDQSAKFRPFGEHKSW